MNRRIMFYCFVLFWALQAVPDESWVVAILKYGTQAGLAGVIFFFYRQDRKDSEQRYEAMANEHTKIVKENTQAITNLLSNINSMAHR